MRLLEKTGEKLGENDEVGDTERVFLLLDARCPVSRAPKKICSFDQKL